MICYKDKTFCASQKCQNKCKRQLTEEEKQEAEKLKLPICYSYFCGSPLGGLSDD